MIEDRFRTGKTYSIRQAANLAGVSQGTVRNWLYGTNAPDGYEMEPVFGAAKEKAADEPAMVSFLELSELIVAARFRKLKIKLFRIREAHDFAREEWKLQYPFAHLKLTSIGGHILHQFEEQHPGPGRFVVLSSPQQYVLHHMVQDELERFEYSKVDQFAERWHPYGKEVPIVVDPRFAGGKPTIAGRGVSIEIVRKRWKAHERVASIAKDFRLKPFQVEAILQHIA